MKHCVLRLITAFALLFSMLQTPSFIAAADASSPDVIHNRLIIEFKDGTTRSFREAALRRHARRITHSEDRNRLSRDWKTMPVKRQKALNRFNQMVVADLENGEDSVALAEALKRDPVIGPSIENAEPDMKVHAVQTPNDPSYSSLWAMPFINAPQAWDLTTGNPNLIVAVIDTGIDYNHPDLVANVWTNPGEIPGNGIDDDGNGIIDDVHGANFNAFPTNGDPMDDHHHGTHCAGTIGAVGNNSVGVAGVNWNVKIMGLKFLDSTGNGSISDAVVAVNYAVAKGAKVLSNSYGGSGGSFAMDAAIQAAWDANVIFVAAAGNNGASGAIYPASAPHAIGVGSVNGSNQRSGFSNFGPDVDLGAPGEGILSTFPGGGYQNLSGTSMATPHVAGAVALMMARNPNLTAQQYNDILLNNAMSGPAELNGKTLDVFGAVLHTPAGGGDTTPPTVSLTAPAAGSFVRSMVSVTANAADNVAVTKVEFYRGATLMATDTLSPYSFSWDTTALADGVYSLTAKAFDAAANNTTSAAVSVTVDNTVPVCSIQSPTTGATVMGNVVIQANASDNNSVVNVDFFRGATLLGSDTSSPYSFTWNTTSVVDGPYTLTVKATDVAGNVTTSANVNINVLNADVTPPVISGVGITNLQPTSVTMVWTTDEPADSQVEYGPTISYGSSTTLNSSLVTSHSQNVTGLTGSTLYHYRVKSKDVSSNAAASGDFTFTTPALPDNTPPTTSITSPVNGATVNGAVTISANATDNVGVTLVEFYVGEVLTGSSTTAPYSCSWNTLLTANGQYSLIAKAYDLAGNSGLSTRVNVTVNNTDVISPVVSITAPSQGATVNGNVSITANATDNVGVALVEFYVDGNLKGNDATTPYAYSWATLLETNGPHTLTAKAFDAAGNEGTSSAINVTVNNPDITPPIVSITSPAQGAVVDHTVVVTVNASDNVGVTVVEFYVDGALKASDSSAPYAFSWDTLLIPDGPHTLVAKAMDAASNAGTSSSITVIVDNPDAVSAPPPTVDQESICRPNLNQPCVLYSQAGMSELIIYSRLGERVASVPVSGDGTFKWHSRNADGNVVADGVYIAKQGSSKKKFVVVK